MQHIEHDVGIPSKVEDTLNHPQLNLYFPLARPLLLHKQIHPPTLVQQLEAPSITIKQTKESPESWISYNLPNQNKERTLICFRIGHIRPTHTPLISHLSPFSAYIQDLNYFKSYTSLDNFLHIFFISLSYSFIFLQNLGPKGGGEGDRFFE